MRAVESAARAAWPTRAKVARISRNAFILTSISLANAAS